MYVIECRLVFICFEFGVVLMFVSECSVSFASFGVVGDEFYMINIYSYII